MAKNIHHSRFSHHPHITHDCIPPRHHQIIFITEWANKHGENAQLNYSYSWKHDSRVTDSKPPIDTSKYDLHSPRAF